MPELPDEIKARPKRKPGQEPTASLTLEAYQRLKAELEELVNVGRERMSERLKVAREHGDIRENAEYDAAKDAQGLMESQIRRLKEALRDPEIIEAPVAADKVVPHMLVTVRSLDDERRGNVPPGRARRGEGARCSDRDHVVSVGSRPGRSVQGPGDRGEGARR